MIAIRQSITVLPLVLALLALPPMAIAADDGPIVNDYSDMGEQYNAPQASDSESGQSDNADATATTDSGNSAESSRQTDADDNGPLYRVNCDGDGACQVGQDVMTGYDTYGGHCARCHGQSGEGSSFAPSLVQQLQDMEQGRFTAAVAGGVTRLDSTTGMYKIMPAWAGNPEVMDHVQQLWAYLKARSDGALPAGRPQPMDAGEG